MREYGRFGDSEVHLPDQEDGSPFGIAGIWENWKDPASGEWVRTFAIITTDANGLVADIHDRMAGDPCAR